MMRIKRNRPAIIFALGFALVMAGFAYLYLWCSIPIGRGSAGDVYKRQIPDGEVFSCPTKFSVNGTIQFNTPTLYSGTKFENVKLELNDGKIVNATSNNTKRLNEILDTDAGARYIGEFSLGFNPYILSPMCDIRCV